MNQQTAPPSTYVAARGDRGYLMHVKPAGTGVALCGATALTWRVDPLPPRDAYKAATYTCQRCIHALSDLENKQETA